jgi:ATP-dependent DNA helicase RecG
MPLPINIHNLLHGETVESERLELKAGWNPESTLHTLCAFANDFHNLGGGYIVIGVAERDGAPILPPEGLAKDAVDRIQKELLQLSNNAIQPPYYAVAEPYTVDGRHILVLWAPGGQTRPYKARVSLAKSAPEMAYYIRKGSSTVRARNADERELLSLAASVPFDDRVNQQAQLEDLSRDLMVGFLDEIKSDLAKPARRMSLETLGRQLGVVAGPREAPLPVNVGLLFFNEHPERFFPATQIDVVWFPEGAGGDRFEEKIFKGPLARMTREALDYIRRNYLSETVIKHHDRAEATRVPNYPFEAVEEALVNAVYHRSYEEREPIEVRISPDDLIVVSYPGPDRSIHLADLRRGKAVARRYRNRRIGEILKELELTEGRSTGIPKILRAMKANGSPPPIFEFDQDHSYFITRLRVHSAVPRMAVTAEADSSTPPATPPATPLAPPPVTPPVGRLLRLVAAKGEIGKAQIREELGLKDRRHLRKVYVEPALAAELIEHTIPEKPSSPLQQYRLTEKGQAWLAADQESREPSS